MALFDSCRSSLSANSERRRVKQSHFFGVFMAAIDRVLNRIERVTESGCWIFTGALNDAGYGVLGKGGRGQGNDRAHRITYAHFVGPIPKGIFVCHICDVRSCCNPSHMFIGTAADNNNDMINKGRGSIPPRNVHDRGEYRYNAKLTEELVKKYRDMHASGTSVYRIQKIAESSGVHISYAPLMRAITGQSWSHVT